MSKLTDNLAVLIRESISEPGYGRAIDVLNDVIDLERTAMERKKLIDLALRLEDAQSMRIMELESALRRFTGAAK